MEEVCWIDQLSKEDDDLLTRALTRFYCIASCCKSSFIKLKSYKRHYKEFHEKRDSIVIVAKLTVGGVI